MSSEKISKNRRFFALQGGLERLEQLIGSKEETDMGYVIFDLDGTVICSKHRQLNKPGGSLDLDHWRENCTAEKIAADSLLPLAESMKAIYEAGHTIIVCTSRICQSYDMEFLDRHGLKYHHFISRHETDARADGEYKIARLEELAEQLGFPNVASMNAIMFDDNLEVIRAMVSIGVHCFDATRENARKIAA